MFSFLFGTTSWNFLTTATTFLGTFRNDYVFSSFRNDSITTGDGNDYVDSGAGNDVISLGRGNDIAYAGNGDDTVDAGEGDDFVDGGNGNDTIRAGSGNDTVFGGNGNDTIIYRADATAGLDRINGGRGSDTLVLELTAAQQTSAAFIADRAAFSSYLAAGSVGTFQFQSISLIVTGGFEQLRIDTVGGPAVNTAPVVSGPVALPAGTEDTAVIITAAALLANTTDAEGNALSVTNLASSSGTVVNNGNGTFTFTPVANANGPVTFTYAVSDGTLSTATTASLNIAAVNDGPVAGAPITLAAIAEDSSVTITAAQLLANATDVDNATLNVTNLTASSGTLVNNNNGTWTFTPAANDDTSVSFSYEITDGQASVASSASLDLTPVNDAPVAGASIVFAAIEEDSSTFFDAAALLANATDVEGDTLTISNISVSSGLLFVTEDGGYEYQSTLNDDTEVTFTYEIFDGTDTTTATATLDLTPVNDLPEFTAASYLDIATRTSVPVTGYLFATDVETSPQDLTYSLYADEGNPTLGTVTLNEDGSYEYTSPSESTFEEGAPFEGLDQFSVRVTDADGGETITTVNINVVSSNESTNYVYANENRGVLVGTDGVQDVFNFYNEDNSEVTQSSGIDYLVNFNSGQDVLFLSGNVFDAADIIANAGRDPGTEGYVYTISPTGAQIISNVQLLASDFSYEIFPS